jgi:hypothetical protein
MIAPWLKTKGAIHAGEFSFDDCSIVCSVRSENLATAPKGPHGRGEQICGGGLSARCRAAPRREKLEFRFRAPLHLLTVCDQGIRSDGDTFVEGLPRSRLRDARRKLTFVPAGHAYHEWQQPRVLTRIVYFYFDPARMPAPAEASAAPVPLAPRLFFDDIALIDTALKLMRLIEHAGAECGPYFGALGSVLAHELVRLNAGAASIEARVLGRARRLATTPRRRRCLQPSLPKGRDVTWDSSESPLAVTSGCSVIRRAPDFIDIAVMGCYCRKGSALTWRLRSPTKPAWWASALHMT